MRQPFCSLGGRIRRTLHSLSSSGYSDQLRLNHLFAGPLSLSTMGPVSITADLSSLEQMFFLVHDFWEASSTLGVSASLCLSVYS